MIKRADELKKVLAENFRGGKGQVEMLHLLDPEKNEFNGKGRLFAKNTLKPGTSIGLHKHEGDFEIYFILKGEGAYNDNGNMITVKAGDVTYTGDGESHSIENIGDTDLEFIALILYS